jgi:hypothetical protein
VQMLNAAIRCTAVNVATFGDVASHPPLHSAAHTRASQLLTHLPPASAGSAMRNPLLSHVAAAERDAMTDAAAAELTPRGAEPPRRASPRCSAVFTLLAAIGLSWQSCTTCTRLHLCAGNPVPSVVHAQAAARGRIICIGDIHGCLEEFRVTVSEAPTSFRVS